MKALTRHAVIVRVLKEAERRGWTRDYTADVMLAQLAQARRKAGVFGPCAYCGSWVASSVDHIIPWSRGGTDEPDNVASACLNCNSAKGDRTADEWLTSMIGATCSLEDSPHEKALRRKAAEEDRRDRYWRGLLDHQAILLKRGFITREQHDEYTADIRRVIAAQERATA